MADPVKLQAQQEFDVAITGVKDARGHTAHFDGTPTWESSDPSIADIRVADDGLSAIVGSFDAIGAATITVTGDAKAGDEVVPVMGVLSVLVVEGDVSVFDFTPGEVRDRAAGTPEEPAPEEGTPDEGTPPAEGTPEPGA